MAMPVAEAISAALQRISGIACNNGNLLKSSEILQTITKELQYFGVFQIDYAAPPFKIAIMIREARIP